jgi:thiol:disulfide interchange protein DsbD
VLLLELGTRGALLALALLSGFPALAQVNPLPPEKAFRFSARALSPEAIEARFAIADGYYLYRDKIHFTVEPARIGLPTPDLPPGKIKIDEFFGRVETFRGTLVVNLPLRDATPGQRVVVKAESQGCADLGICYPPNVQQVTVALPAVGTAPGPAVDAAKKSWFN